MKGKGSSSPSWKTNTPGNTHTDSPYTLISFKQRHTHSCRPHKCLYGVSAARLQPFSLFVWIFVTNAISLVSLQTQGQMSVWSVWKCVGVCVCLLHSVTCSISCRAASPCNESALEGMFPQITKLLTAQAGATELFPQPGDCVGVISGL